VARTPFQIQKAVVFALFIRELKTRFGSYRLGYVWAMLEPVAHVLVLTLIWSALGRKEFFGIPVALFLFTGMVPFLFFQKTASMCMKAVTANKGLFNYRQVRPIDPVLARVLLESIFSIFVSILLLWAAGWFFDYEVWPDNLLGLIVINSGLFVLTFAISLIMSIYGELYPEALKLVPMIVFRAMYFTSGVIFPLAELPKEYQAWLLWNPMLHVIELNHIYYFQDFSSPDVSLLFIGMFSIVALTFGLLSYRSNWVRMVTA